MLLLSRLPFMDIVSLLLYAIGLSVGLVGSMYHWRRNRKLADDYLGVFLIASFVLFIFVAVKAENIFFSGFP